MNGRDLLFTLKDECFKIGNYYNIKQNYKILQESLIDVDVTNYFHQLKNISLENPTFELCFLNVMFVHHISISSETCVHTVIEISSISKLNIESDSKTSFFNLNIYGYCEGILLSYSFTQDRFE